MENKLQDSLKIDNAHFSKVFWTTFAITGLMFLATYLLTPDTLPIKSTSYSGGVYGESSEPASKIFLILVPIFFLIVYIILLYIKFPSPPRLNYIPESYKKIFGKEIKFEEVPRYGLKIFRAVFLIAIFTGSIFINLIVLETLSSSIKYAIMALVVLTIVVSIPLLVLLCRKIL